jgi:hypothetical protein
VTAFVPPVQRKNGTSYGKPTHWYVDGNGVRIPGVTTLIDQGVPKPALIGWASNVTAEYALDHWDALSEKTASERLKELKGARFANSDAAAKRGTEVHRLAEELLVGHEVAVPPELAGHVESYVRFLDEWDPVVILSETAVANLTIGYAGTLDLVADMAGERWLCDVKTGRTGIYGETALQLAAYRYAEHYLDDKGEMQPMVQVDRCAAIWVRADGYDLLPVRADESVFTEFRYAGRVARWQTETSKTVVSEALRPMAS